MNVSGVFIDSEGVIAKQLAPIKKTIKRLNNKGVDKSPSTKDSKGASSSKPAATSSDKDKAKAKTKAKKGIGTGNANAVKRKQRPGEGKDERKQGKIKTSAQEKERIDVRLSPRANARRLIAFQSVRMLNYMILNLAFHDLTNATAIVPTSMKHVLGLGLKFCPTPPSIPTAYYTAALPALLARFQNNSSDKFSVTESDSQMEIGRTSTRCGCTAQPGIGNFSFIQNGLL